MEALKSAERPPALGIRLDRQPEATRRAYAKEYGIPLRELGM